jgi:hypothetical protein
MSLWQHSSLLEVIGIKPFALPFIPLDVINGTGVIENTGVEFFALPFIPLDVLNGF